MLRAVINGALLLMLSAACLADKPVVELVIRDHLFYPSQLKVPANVKFKLRVDNQDPTPEEFESYELNREKVILGKRRAIIFIGPLAPGVYPFFGEFNPKTAQGTMIAE
ncbi:cupredoxin domain-containing protein [Spongiibacter marinus]|uniref:cupredoxin domain-containing protein n=1 Tax=Spongiibacter marinus TaxID=354246 RepID=UPI003C5CD22B